jgi:hypothetical protein
MPAPVDPALHRALGMASGFLVNVVAPAYPTSDGLRVKILSACGMSIGAGTIIKSQCFLVGHAQVQVGEGCFIGARTVLEASAQITIEDRVFIAHRVNLLTATHVIGSQTMRASLPAGSHRGWLLAGRRRRRPARRHHRPGLRDRGGRRRHLRLRGQRAVRRRPGPSRA